MRKLVSAAVAAAMAGAVALGGAVSVAPTASGADTGAPPHEPHAEHAVCANVPAGQARCHVHVLDTGDGVTPLVSGSPTGKSPATIKSVYNFPTSVSAGAGQTIAVVDAYDDPTAAADLTTFSNQYGLPCNNCLTKVNETGGLSPLPSMDPQWALEISLDIQWAHAIAPGANILLVEAYSADISSLLFAEDYASAHANYVTDSWGGPELSYESIYDSHFTHPGVSYFVASGDSGATAEYPSASPNVISVGGTQLNAIGTPAFSETAWSGGGGGCSAYEAANAAQSSFSQYGQVHCPTGMRATPDVSANSSPSSGVSVVDTTIYGGWLTVGGTSAASPLWAARSADTGSAVTAPVVYGNTITFRDITSGTNGQPTLIGYDLATGRGSWIQPAPAPGPPTLNTATGGVGSVALAWSAPTTGGAPASYNVYRSASSGPVVQVATGIAGTTYTDTVSAGTYTYQVSAVNATGTEGPLSNALSATATAPPQPPGPPALTSATGGVGSVALTWSAPTTGGTATSYNVYRGIFSAGETLLQSGVTSLNYTDNVAAGTYYYEVTAVNGNGEGPRSNEQSATSTPAPPVKPGPPTLTAATGGVGSVALTWSAPTTGGTATSYNVYRGTSSGGEALLRTGVTTLNYTDNVSAGTYFYEVTAVNGSGEGPLSNEASGTATAAPPPPPGPVASFTKACTYSVCIYNSTSTDAGGTITTYAWSGGNNFTGSAYRTAHGYTAAGTFSVVLTVTDSNHAQATASGNVTCTYDQYHRLVCV